MSRCLLCKWLWKLENKRTWQEVLSKNYLSNQVLSRAIVGPGSSHFWQSLVGVNHTFYQFVKTVMNNGEKTLFLKYAWLNVPTLSSIP